MVILFPNEEWQTLEKVAAFLYWGWREELQLSGFTLSTTLGRQITAPAPCGLSLKATQNHMYPPPPPHTLCSCLSTVWLGERPISKKQLLLKRKNGHACISEAGMLPIRWLPLSEPATALDLSGDFLFRVLYRKTTTIWFSKLQNQSECLLRFRPSSKYCGHKVICTGQKLY